MVNTTVHTGDLASVPPTPGLQLLKSLLPLLDSLSPTDLSAYLTADAGFTLNGGNVAGQDQLQGMFRMRAEKLSSFGHEIARAWDVENEDGSRTVLYEGWSVSTFKSDGEVIKVWEFGVADCVDVGGGWKVRSVKTYVDTGPVIARRARIMREGGA